MADDRGAMLPKADRPAMVTAVIVVILGNAGLLALPQELPLVASLFVVPVAIAAGLLVNYLIHGRIWLQGRST
ncbi:MAG: hypothetical protein SVG88_02400 [Halobacteriales archaeon]|nr:hypothetical protein [Halobacteriales archaeon]